MQNFMLSDAIARFIVGPVGSGKTYCCLYEMIRRMAQQERGQDGFRRTRWAIVRQTLQQIKTSVLKDIELIFAPIMRYRVSENTIYIAAGDIRAEILLIPLDTPEDQRRLLSTQLTGVFFNEFEQINLELVVAAMGRLGRYPSPMMGGPTWYGLIADSNPGTTDSMWYDKLVNNCPRNWDYFHQPSPINAEGEFLPDAENINNLVDNYYQNLLEGATENWAERYIFGNWGESLSSQAVFHNSFIPDFHIAEDELTPIQGGPVVIGMDMARNPAAVFGQIDSWGRLLVFHTEYRDNMGVQKFIREVIKPFIYSERMQGLPALICGDPSGIARSQIGEQSVFDMLKFEGFQAFPASTNLIPPRLRSVESWLNQQRDGRAAILFDPVNTAPLIQAMRSGYRYKKRKAGDLDDKPDKNHPDSDLADALQYLCLGINSPYMGRIMRPPQPGRPPPSTTAWT